MTHVREYTLWRDGEMIYDADTFGEINKYVGTISALRLHMKLEIFQEGLGIIFTYPPLTSKDIKEK